MATGKNLISVAWAGFSNYFTYRCREAGKNDGKKKSTEKKKKVDVKPVKDSVSLIMDEYDWKVAENNINNLSTVVLTGVVVLGGTAISLAVIPPRVGALVFAMGSSGGSLTAYTISKPLIALTGIGSVAYYCKSELKFENLIVSEDTKQQNKPKKKNK